MGIIQIYVCPMDFVRDAFLVQTGSAFKHSEGVSQPPG